jgi:hypothetical protein
MDTAQGSKSQIPRTKSQEILIGFDFGVHQRVRVFNAKGVAAMSAQNKL